MSLGKQGKLVKKPCKMCSLLALRRPWNLWSLLPGWWRREGGFLLTVAAERPLPEPVQLPGSADLAAAEPVHSCVDRPLV